MDSVVIFKMVFIQYIFGICSMPIKGIETAAMNLKKLATWSRQGT